ncbi:MAG: AAA family ATPase [Epulopiscium sp. Nele67-Bin002]|nr:MAG: AAA family ATPase [Epulopiscium sp. Nele67-Bin002]
MYLNTKQGFNNFKKIVSSDLYVDKSMILDILNKRVNKDNCYICITRPRRFGKSEITNLIESYYSTAIDSKKFFDKLEISKTANYLKHLNKYNVIKIDFSELDEDNSYNGYIGRIKSYLVKGLEQNYQNIDFNSYRTISDKFTATGDRFIFIFDEWDFIFNKGLYIEQQEEFLDFLRNLLKGKAYVSLCYMTGILPIKLHSTGSALNIFEEYTFINDGVFSKYFGFTESEVMELCKQNDGISYEEVAHWYNGYTTKDGIRIFNPRSVKIALINNDAQSYWTSTGAMDEVLEYLKLDATGSIVNDVIKMINNETIFINILREFRAGSKVPTNKDEIYAAMITWGFLSYYNEELRIPNRELMIEFELALKDNTFGELSKIIKNADEMLRATLNRDAKKVAKIVHDIHNSEIPILKYTDENSTSCVLTLAYLSARNKYRIEREEKSGKGFVDFVFHPRNSVDIPIVVELKRNSSTKMALKQVMEREYVNKYMQIYKRDVLVVAINYSDKKKSHTCAIVNVEFN